MCISGFPFYTVTRVPLGNQYLFHRVFYFYSFRPPTERYFSNIAETGAKSVLSPNCMIPYA